MYRNDKKNTLLKLGFLQVDLVTIFRFQQASKSFVNHSKSHLSPNSSKKQKLRTSIKKARMTGANISR